MRMHRSLLIVAAALYTTAPAGCQTSRQQATGPVIGHVEVLDPSLDGLIDPQAQVHVLADGYEWTEGPVWIPAESMLLFSDTDTNTIHRWKEKEGASPWLTPSGYTGQVSRGGGLGSNGLALDARGHLVLCQHGDRRVARMIAPLSAPAPKFETLAGAWEGRRLSSPNDLVLASDGTVYFTDPPYGLVSGDAAELGFNGVYRLGKDGALSLVDSTLSRPNGIALSPDGRTLYVANSDPARAFWMAYNVAPDGGVSNGRVFHDATSEVGPQNPGLPDGLKLDVGGNLFATGPGGVWVLTPDGRHLGTIRTEVPTANVAFGDDGQNLYLTSDMYLARIATRTTGLGFPSGAADR